MALGWPVVRRDEPPVFAEARSPADCCRCRPGGCSHLQAPSRAETAEISDADHGHYVSEQEVESSRWFYEFLLGLAQMLNWR